MQRIPLYFVLAFLLLFILPLGLHAALLASREDLSRSWRGADWSSTGLLPDADAHPEAMVRIYAARVGRWRGIFAVHCWIVLKERGGAYERFDKVGWGMPVRRNAYAPDARWYGHEPELMFTAEGTEAQALLPRLRAAIDAYPFDAPGDYQAWPGPNSNTFVASVVSGLPEMAGALPSTAIGKDFPADGRWIGPAASNTGLRLSLGGYAGLTLAWVEGLEISLFGAVAGLDLRRPAVKLPGFGRLGMSPG